MLSVQRAGLGVWSRAVLAVLLLGGFYVLALAVVTALPWQLLPLRGYYWLYWSISSVVLRRQELEADRCAASVVDGPTVAGALCELHAIKAAWRTYLTAYIGLDRSGEYAPDNICGSFRAFLDADVVSLDALRRELPDQRIWRDTHPPLAQRVAMLECLAATVSPNNASAASLVPNLRGYGPRLDAVAFPLDNRTRLPFEEFAVCVTRARVQRDAVVLYRAASAIDATAAGLARVLDLLAAGHAQRLAAEVVRTEVAYVDQLAAVHALTVRIEAALVLAAVNGGAAQWRYSFQAGMELVDGNGQAFPSGAPLGLARFARTLCVGSPEQIADARARLAGLGVNETKGMSPDTADTALGEVLGAIAYVMANGRYYDLLIFVTGLVLVPGPIYMADTQWLELLVEHIPTTTLREDHWRLPYSDIVGARILHRSRANVLLTLRNNTAVRIDETIGSPRLTLEQGDPRRLLREIARRIGTSDPAQTKLLAPAVPPSREPVDDADQLVKAGRRLRARYMIFVATLILPFDIISTMTYKFGYAAFGVTALGLLIGWHHPRDIDSSARVIVVIGAGLVIAIVIVYGGPAIDMSPVAALGVLLVGLGVARFRGRWPKRSGNGCKVVAATAAAIGLWITIASMRTSQPEVMAFAYWFWGLTVFLFVIGIVLAAREATAAEVVAWRRNKAFWYGALAMVTTPVVPVGMVFGVLSIRQAHKTGTGPPLAGVIAVMLPPLLTIVIALSVIAVPG